MNFKEILELIDKVADREIGSLEVERSGFKLRIEGRPAPQPVAAPVWTEPQPSAATPPAAAPRPAAAAAAAEPDEVDQSWHVITSPIVGTFYRSPNPESEAFVREGDRIAKGKVLCIIEAMKLMNEIESDVDGVIMKVFPQNGQPIEYGEKLFAVKL